MPGGCHSSRTGITPCLKQPTRGLRPGRPQASSYLVLLRTGFAELAASPRQLVGSYPTVSPLPGTHFAQETSLKKMNSQGKVSAGRSVFCGTFPGSPPLDVIQRPALWSPDFPPGTHFAQKNLSKEDKFPGQSECRATACPTPAFKLYMTVSDEGQSRTES